MRYGTVIIGGGQAGLSVAYHLGLRGSPCLVLEADERVGDAWRRRWDSLRLFSPAKYDGLDGLPFPAPPWSFPARDEMADYLEDYVARFALPVRTGVRVDGLRRVTGGYEVTAGAERFEAANVVLACGTYQVPRVPAFAAELDPRIRQVHSSEWRNATQLVPGDVLVVGAGNSGTDLALQAVAAGHRTWLAGRHPGQVPFDIDGRWARWVMVRLVLRGAFHHLMTLRNPLARKVMPKVLSRGGPLIRYRRKDVLRAGVTPLPRVAGVRDGGPVLPDGSAVAAANVLWCTGYEDDWSWVELPGFADARPAGDAAGAGGHGPEHVRGEVTGHPGLYLVGRHFLFAMSSAMIHGVGRDAAHVAARIAARGAAPVPAAAAHHRR